MYYHLDDNRLELTDIIIPNVDPVLFGKADYLIDSVGYTYNFRNFTYDPVNMEFDEGELNEGFSEEADENTLHFYVYLNGVT
ncbi:hypothetical protein [Ruminococcus sp.]|uniref:hypothetical protein n=1 Tax=Ruminococcus sp. TaxID=41978 RepID=UPI0025CDC406|nr:hypothetical protein [Ruminococcus sp.]MBQ8967140.1 hypothetical protein [Ruminococcus sp.]